MSTLPNISPELLAKYKAEIGRLNSPTTVSRKNSSLKHFFSWAEKKGHIEENPFGGAKSEQQEIRTTGEGNQESRLAGTSIPSPSITRYSDTLKIFSLVAGGLIIILLAVLISQRLPVGKNSIFVALKSLAQFESKTVTRLPGNTVTIPTPTTTPNGPITNHPSPITSQQISSDTITAKLINMIGDSPLIKSIGGALGIEGPALTLQTSPTSDGDITLSPDGNGSVNIRSSTTTNNSVDIKNANLTTGNLISGYVGNNGSGYNLLYLSSGSSLVERFSVDAQGNVYASGALTVYSLQSTAVVSSQLTVDRIDLSGDLKVGGVTRLNSLGRLASITGYYQDSGLFEIDQGSPDTATIEKTPTSTQGPATADVLKLTLDETNTTASNSDTLVLERKNADTTGYALDVRTGNANFEGNVSINGTLTTGGTGGLTTPSLTVTGNTSVGGNLGVTGATTLSSTLTVSGTTTLNGTANIGDGGDAVTISNTTFSQTSTSTTTFNLADNITDALDIQEGTRNYININTTDSSENISFGNATTNPTYNFLGTGAITVAGSAEGTNAIVATAGDITATSGDLALNSTTPDIKTTAVGTGSIFNTNLTTLNIGGAATTVSLGAATGTTTVNNSLTVSGTSLLATSATTVTLGSAGADAITIGNGGADTITIGNAAATGVSITDDNWSVSTAGVAAFGSYLQVGSATATTYSRFGTGATGHSLSGADDVLISGDLEVDGSIYFDGTLNTTNLVNTGTFTTSGGEVNINANSDFATNINTGTSTGAVSIGGGSSTIALSGTTVSLTANGAGNDITFNLVDNNANALDIQEGANNYINIGTLDAGATMAFGNATTNPTYSFLGTGDFVIDSTGTFSAISAATINLGTANVGSTIQIGTEGTTADTITIGNSNAATTLALTGGDDWSITAGGILTLDGTALDVDSLDFVGAGSITTGGTNTDLTLNPAGTGDIYFHGATYNISDTGDLTIGGRITFENGAYIQNEVDGTLYFNEPTLQLVGSTAIDIDSPSINLSTQATDIEIADHTASALTISEGANNYFLITTTNTAENISFGNATTNPSYSFLGTGAVTITGSADGTDALIITAGDILVSNGDFDLSGGDFNITLDDQDVFNLVGTAAASTAGNGAAAANLITATGPAGQATSGITGQTGGAGSAFSFTGGVGGAATGASGSNIGGAGGALTLAGGAGGAATSGTGGAGGAISITAGAAGTGGNANGGTLTLNSGAVTGSGTSTINFGTSNSTVINIGDSTVTKTIDIGGVTSSDASTINIATEGTAADTITIGNSNASTTLALTGGTSWSVSTAGLITTADDAAINGGDITTTSATFNLANAATTLNLGSTAVARAINIGTGTLADTINIGNGGTTADLIYIGNSATANTITIGSTSSTGVSITDDNWNVTAGGAANFVSVGAATPGTGAFTTLSSTSTTTLASDAGASTTIGNTTGTFSVTGTTLGFSANGAGNDITFNLVDNNTDALDVQEGANNYLNINTTNSSENISFGNATTNPSYSFLGTGAVTIAGSAEGTASLTQTAGDHLISDGDLILSGGEISATSDDATGTNFNFVTGALSTGTGLGIASTVSSATASFSGDIGALSSSRTNSTAAQTLTDSGNILDLARTTITNNGTATTNVTGPILNITNTATQTLGTLSDSANLVVVTQDADATGALLHLVSNRSSTNYSLLIEQTSGGTDTLSLTDAGNLAINGDFTVTGGDLNGPSGENIDLGEATADTITFYIAGTAETTLTSSAFSPATTDSNALGTTSLMWSDLFLASEGVINFNNGDVTVTHAADALTIAGGAVTISGSAEGTAALTLTAGDLVLTDGDLILSGGEISATSDDATGTNFNFVTGTLTSGTGMNLVTTASGSTAFTGDIFSGSFSQTWTAASSPTNTGNVLDLSRALTVNAATQILTQSGALAKLSSSGTETLGDIADSSNILLLEQNCGTGVTCTGSVLKITNSGTGADIELKNGETLSNSTDGQINFGADKLDLDTTATSGTLFNVDYGAAMSQAGALIGANIDLYTNVTTGNNNQIGLQIGMRDGGASSTTAGIAFVANSTSDRGIDFSNVAIQNSGTGGAMIYNTTSGAIDLAAAADNTLTITNSSGTTVNDNIITLAVDANTDASDKILFRIISDVGGANSSKVTIDSDGDIVANSITAAQTHCTDCLDYADFSDAMSFDANLTIAQTTYTDVQSFTGDTTVGKTYNANSLTTGTAVKISSTTGFTSGGELLDLTANSTQTGNLITASATSLTTGKLLSFTGPSGGTVGVTSDIVSLTSDIGNTGKIISSTGTIDTTGAAESGYNLYLSTTNSNTTNANTAYGVYSTLSDAVALGNTNYAGYFTVSNTGANTAGTKNVYGVAGIASGTAAGVGGSSNSYGGYFTATGDAGGTSTAWGIYATASGADTNYAGIFDAGLVGIGTTAPAAELHIVAPASTAGVTLTGTQASSTSGNGADASSILSVTGTPGQASSGVTGQTGGVGSAASLTGGVGGAVAGAGGIGGAGGALTFAGGAGGNGATTGGAGGAISITAGAAGTGGNANGGTLTLDSGNPTGTGTSAINIGTAASLRAITLGNNTGATSLALTSGTGSQTFTSSVATGTTTTSAFVFTDSALTSGTLNYLTSGSVTTGKLLDIATSGNTWTGNSTTSGLVNLASTSTAGTASDSDILLNIARSGANSNTAHTAYGLYSSVTNTNVTSGTNVGGYFSASGATTANYAIQIGSGSLRLDSGTLDVSAAATNIAIKDNTAGALTVKQGTNTYLDVTTTDDATAVTLDLPVAGVTTTTGNLFTAAVNKTVNISDSVSTNTIDIGGVTNSGTDTINIATNSTAADVITIGNANAATTLALTSGTAWSVTTAGAAALDSLTVGGGYGSTGVTISNAGAIQANGALTVDGNATISGGTIDVSAAATNIAIKDNTASTLTIKQGSDIYFNISTTNDSESMTLDLPAGGVTSLTANLFTSNIAKTINLGTGTAADTIHIGEGGTNANTITIGSDAVANTITIGSASATSVSITDDNWSISTAGVANFGSILQVGSTTNTTYSRFGTATTGHSLAGADALLVSGALEVDGAVWADGQFTLGDNGDTGAIDTSDWDITAEGNMSGIGTLGMDGDLTITQATPSILFVDNTAASDDYSINVDGSSFIITNDTDTRNDITISGTGAVTINGAAVGEGTSQLTLSSGDLTITDGDLILSGGEISATADDATGTNFSFVTGALSTGTGLGVTSTSNAYTSGSILSASLAQSAATGTSVSGDIASVAFSPTYSTAVTTPAISGSVLDISRTTTTNSLFASTLTVTGPILNITNTAAQTTGTLTDSSNLVVVTQDADATGALLHLVSNRSSTNYSLLIEQTSGGTDTLSLTDAGNLAINGDFTVTGGDLNGPSGENIDLGEATADTITSYIAGTAETTLTSSAFSPATTDSNALGTTALMWSDLFLASGGVINFDNGDVTVTHGADALTIAGGAVTISGSADGTDALIITAGDILVSNGDLDLSGGDFNITLDDQDVFNLVGTVASSTSGNGATAANIFTILGPAGQASSGVTGQTGGVGSGASLTGGAGGAVAGASGIGGAGGALTFAAGAGGNGAATGGAGGAISITAGAAGTGGNANGGTLTLNSGAVTGSGTSTINLGSSNTTNLNIGTAAVANAITIGSASSTGVSITDDNWSVTAAGVANFVSVGATTAGTGKFTTLESTSTTNLGSGGAATITLSSNTTLAAAKTFAWTTGIIDANGNVGVGTTAPAGILHVAGQCVAEGTLIRRRKRKKRRINSATTGPDPDSNSEIDFAPDSSSGFQSAQEWEDIPVEDIEPGDKVLSLNDATGEFEWHTVEKTMNKGIQKVFELITESGKSIKTTAEHPYFARIQNSIKDTNWIQKSTYEHCESLAKNFYLQKLEGRSIKCKALGEAQVRFTRTGWNHFSEKSRSLNELITRFFALPRVLPAVKYSSRVISYEKRIKSDMDVEYWTLEAIIDWVIVRVTICAVNNQDKFFLSCIWKGQAKEEGIKKGAVSRLYPRIQAWDKSLTFSTSFEQELSLSPQPVALGRPRELVIPQLLNRIITDNGKWVKVSQLTNNHEIATVDGWEKIVSIKEIGKVQTYDLQIEGTHNFVGGHYVNVKTKKALTPEQERAYLEYLSQQKTGLSDGSLTELQTNAATSDLSNTNITENASFVNTPLGNVDLTGVAPAQSDLRDPKRHWSRPTPRSLSQILGESVNEEDVSFGGIVAHNTSIFGAGEGGTPTATTIRGAAASGTDIAGANFTFDASNGTGTGGSGSLIFRTAPAAGSSSTANTLATRLTLASDGAVTIASGGTSAWTNTAGNLTIQTATSGTLALDSAGALNVGGTNATSVGVGRSGVTTTVNGTLATTSPAITTSLTTPSASFDLLNTTATTLNFGGAATTLSIGAGTGTTTVNNALTVTGTLTANTFVSSGVTITGGSINNTTIGASTPSTGAFTTLTSSGNTTLGTGASGTHTYSTGAGSTTTLGNSTGALTIASGGTSAWTNTSGNLTISTATSGSLNLTSAGTSTYALAANTASAFRFTDGTNAYQTIDTRTATSGVSAFTFATGTAPTIASAATAYFNATTFTPGTVNFSGSTQITSTGTSANNAMLFNQPTINRTDAATSLTIDQASNLFINGPTIASHATVGQTETITTSSALRIGAGSSVAGTRGVVTNAYGLYVDAPTGATNNYAAVFASGNVGIGTTGPGYLLDVAGTVNINKSVYSDPTGENGFRLKVQDYGGINNDAGIGIAAANGAMWFNNVAGAGYYFNFGTNGQKITFDSNGNVGIGTTGPGAGLDVQAVASGRTILVGNVDSTNEGGEIQWEGAQSGYETWTTDIYQDKFRIFKSSTSTDNTDQVQIFNADGTGIAGLYVEGNVGIGTASPNTRVHISAADNNTYGQVEVQSTGTDARIELYNSGAAGSGGRTGIIGSSTSGYEGIRFMINNADKVIIDENGNVGIGTTSPTQRLDTGTGNIATYNYFKTNRNSVNAINMYNNGMSLDSYLSVSVNLDNDNNDTTEEFKVVTNAAASTLFTVNASAQTLVNTTTAPDSNIKLSVNGYIKGTFGTDQATSGLCWSSSGPFGGNVIVDCNGTPGDIAEWYPVDQSIETGDIVTPATNRTISYERGSGNPWTGEASQNTGIPNQTINVFKKAVNAATIVGVTSDSPYQTFGEDIKNAVDAKGDSTIKAFPVALGGRVPVKVTTENGPIKAGDSITISPTHPGVGMKATKAGRVIGQALENYTNTDPTVIGKTLVFINPSWYDPDVYLTDTGDLSIVAQSEKFKVKSSNGNFIERIGAFGEVLAATIQGGIIKTTELVADIGSFNKLRANELQVADRIISPIVKVDQLEANKITANEITANRIRANQIEGIEGVFEQLSASQSAVQELAFSKETSTQNSVIDKLRERLDSLSENMEEANAQNAYYEQAEKVLDANASGSAELADASVSWSSNPSLITNNSSLSLTNDFNVMGDINVFGTTRLAETYVQGDLTISSSDPLITNHLSLSTNTISVFGGALQILASEGVDIMNGALLVDSSGNVKIKGDLFVGGTATVRQLDVVAPNSSNESNLTNGTNPVASIDASGSATLRKLVIAAPQETATPSAQIANNEVTSNSTAGVATLPAGQTLITIHSSLVTDNSLVYVTPQSSTNNQTLYVLNKVAGSYFTVAIDRPVQADIKFNWWIIDLKQ